MFVSIRGLISTHLNAGRFIHVYCFGTGWHLSCMGDVKKVDLIRQLNFSQKSVICMFWKYILFATTTMDPRN